MAAGKLAMNVMENGGRTFLKGGGMGFMLRSVGPRLVRPMSASLADFLLDHSSPTLPLRGVVQSGRVVKIVY